MNQKKKTKQTKLFGKKTALEKEEEELKAREVLKVRFKGKGKHMKFHGNITCSPEGYDEFVKILKDASESKDKEQKI